MMSKEFDDYKQSLRSTIKKEVGVILVEGVCEYTDLSICEFKFWKRVRKGEARGREGKVQNYL